MVRLTCYKFGHLTWLIHGFKYFKNAVIIILRYQNQLSFTYLH